MKRCKVMEMIKNIVMPVLLIALGVIFLAFSGPDFSTAMLLVSIASLVAGAYMIVHYFVNAKELADARSLVLGFVLIGCAIPLFFESILIIYFLGVVLAAAGAYLLGRALEQKRAGKGCWLKDLIPAILYLVLGFAYYLILWGTGLPFETLLAVALIICGVYQCVAMFVFRGKKKKAE